MGAHYRGWPVKTCLGFRSSSHRVLWKVDGNKAGSDEERF